MKEANKIIESTYLTDLKNELQRIRDLEHTLQRGIVINLLKSDPKQILTLFSDLLGSFTQYVEFDDKQFNVEFNRWCYLNPIAEDVSTLSDLEKRYYLYQDVAKNGLLFSHLISILWKETDAGWITYHPNLIEVILNEFETTLHHLERDLERRGFPKKLHRGLIWYERGKIHSAKNRGMLSFNAINKSIEEDVITYGSTYTTGMAHQLKERMMIHLYKMINDIDDHSKQTINADIFQQIYRNLLKIEEKMKVELRDQIELVFSYAYGVGYNQDLSIPDHEENLRIENEFRMFYTTVEQLLRNLTEGLPSYNKLQNEDLNVAWTSLGGLNPSRHLKTPFERKCEQNDISQSVLVGFYHGSTPIPDMEDILFPSKKSPEIQLSALRANLLLEPLSFDSYYTFKILNRARNLFLHNTLPMKAHLSLNERRKLIRSVILFLDMYLEKITQSITNGNEDWESIDYVSH